MTLFFTYYLNLILSMEEPFKTVENFYEFVEAKLMTIAGKQNLDRLRKCSRKWQLCTLFYTWQPKCCRRKWYSFTESQRKHSERPMNGRLRFPGKIPLGGNSCAQVSNVLSPSLLLQKKFNLVFIRPQVGPVSRILCHWFSPCFCPNPASLVWNQL